MKKKKNEKYRLILFRTIMSAARMHQDAVRIIRGTHFVEAAVTATRLAINREEKIVKTRQMGREKKCFNPEGGHEPDGGRGGTIGRVNSVHPYFWMSRVLSVPSFSPLSHRRPLQGKRARWEAALHSTHLREFESLAQRRINL